MHVYATSGIKNLPTIPTAEEVFFGSFSLPLIDCQLFSRMFQSTLTAALKIILLWIVD